MHRRYFQKHKGLKKVVHLVYMYDFAYEPIIQRFSKHKIFLTVFYGTCSILLPLVCKSIFLPNMLTCKFITLNVPTCNITMLTSKKTRKKASDKTFLQICMSNPLETTTFQIFGKKWNRNFLVIFTSKHYVLNTYKVSRNSLQRLQRICP